MYQGIEAYPKATEPTTSIVILPATAPNASELPHGTYTLGIIADGAACFHKGVACASLPKHHATR